jgi:hypothetical protein
MGIFRCPRDAEERIIKVLYESEMDLRIGQLLRRLVNQKSVGFWILPTLEDLRKKGLVMKTWDKTPYTSYRQNLYSLTSSGTAFYKQRFPNRAVS